MTTVDGSIAEFAQLCESTGWLCTIEHDYPSFVWSDVIDLVRNQRPITAMDARSIMSRSGDILITTGTFLKKESLYAVDVISYHSSCRKTFLFIPRFDHTYVKIIRRGCQGPTSQHHRP